MTLIKSKSTKQTPNPNPLILGISYNQIYIYYSINLYLLYSKCALLQPYLNTPSQVEE